MRLRFFYILLHREAIASSLTPSQIKRPLYPVLPPCTASYPSPHHHHHTKEGAHSHPEINPTPPPHQQHPPNKSGHLGGISIITIAALFSQVQASIVRTYVQTQERTGQQYSNTHTHVDTKYPSPNHPPAARSLALLPLTRRNSFYLAAIWPLSRSR